MAALNYDYELLYKLFSRAIKERLNLIMAELSGNGKIPPAPFIAFDVIAPYIPYNYLEDDPTFESVVSFTAYGKSKLSSLNTCLKVRDLFGDPVILTEFQKQGIGVVERMDVQIRSTEETVMTAYMTGFDMRLRISNPYESDVEGIDDIQINGGPIDE